MATGPPESFKRSGLFVVRSWLIGCQVLPKSVDLKTTLPLSSTVFLSCGDWMIGEFQLKRYFMEPAAPPSSNGCGLTSCCSRVRKLVRTMLPPCDSER